MKRTLLEKQVVLQKIAENRAELRYELKALQAGVNPISAFLSLSKHAGPLITSLAALARSLFGDAGQQRSRRLDYGALIPVLVPLLRLVLERRGSRS